jgi:hypothetical protein
MNPYARADALDQERQEEMRLADLRLESAMDEAFRDADSLEKYLADWSEDSLALNRFAQAVRTLYLDIDSMTPKVMLFRGALYALIKTRCLEEWQS